MPDNSKTRLARHCLLASNTSSLSPTALAAGLAHPERLVGLHFFNPVPAMKLVEVISGLATAPRVADAAADLAAGWGKTVVRYAATPGVHHQPDRPPLLRRSVAVYEEHASVPQVIDLIMTGAGGFLMGPFALMELIGHDVNEAVTRSVWAAFGYDPRYTPGMIVTRTVAMLANLAADAVGCRVASEADIDSAMRLGVNYPAGPLAWARQWGIGTVLRILDSLEDWYRDGHYRASPLLRRAALEQR